jgi:outer membrane murein-binding lipoprotein Lpp
MDHSSAVLLIFRPIGTALALGSQTRTNMTTPRSKKLLLAAFVGSLLLAACTNSPTEQKEETNKAIDKIEDKMTDSQMAGSTSEWEKERADILADLRGLRDNIGKDLAANKVDLADMKMKPSVREDKEALKVELKREKAKVDAMMVKAEGATDATWRTTKADLQKGAEDVKGWWARLKENVDKKTDSDNDNDGH